MSKPLVYLCIPVMLCLATDAVCGKPPITLSHKQTTYTDYRTGQSSWHIVYYYTIQNHSRRVSFLGRNIGKELRRVDQARRAFRGYGALKGTGALLILGGLATTVSSLAMQLSDENREEDGKLPTLDFTIPITGCGIALSAWAPAIISRVKLRRAVAVYNE
jgi:hypothetical protein